MKKQFQSKSVPRGTRTIWRYLGALFLIFTLGIGQMWAADITVKLYVHGGTISADGWSSKSSGTYFQKKVAKSTPFDIPAPTQEGYSFVNWTVNEDGTGDSYTTSHSGSGSNITLHAQWLELPYTPTHLIDNKLKVNAEWNSKFYTTDATNITGLVDWQVAPGKDRTSNVTDKQTGKSDRTPAIFTTSTKEDDNYMYLSFTIASGKRLKLSAVNIPVFGISNSKTTLVEIEDAYSTKISVNGTITKDADGNGFGSYDFANVPYLKGTVTVKMWAYGSADGYRMKTPVYLDGTISDAPTEYAVSFDKNNEGASGTMSALYYEAGAVVTLPACGFTAPTGMEFDAWTSTDVTITSNQFTMPAKAVTIKATWKSAADKYTVHYMDADGTTPLAADELVEVTQKPAGLAEDPTKPLYTFAAWQKDAADIALDAEFWATVVKDAEITLTARWTKAYAQSIDMEQFVIDNKKSGNWKDYLDAANIAYSADGLSLDSLDSSKGNNNYPYLGLKFNKNKTADLYVTGNLKAGKLMIVKVGNISSTHMDIDGVTQTTPAIVGGTDTEPACTYWYYNADKEFKLVKTNSSTASVLKAIVITNPYEVTYNANGGDPVAPATFTGTALTLPSAINGTASFLGWFDAATGGNKIGEAGDSYIPSASIELFAHWEAISTDNTLSDLKVGGETVDGFDPAVHTYYVVLPYGTKPENIPAITATAHSAKAKQVAIEQAVWTGEPYNCYRAQANVQAEDMSWGYYDVRFSFAPKDGVSLVKIVPSSQTKGTQTGIYHDGDELTINLSSGMNLGGSGKYIGVKATENFQEGDVLHLDLTAKPNTSGSTQIILYAEKEATNEVWATGELASEAKDYYLTLPAAVNGHNELYIVRTEGNKWNGGPSVMEVTRAMNPMLTAMTIDGRTVTINEAAKTATVTIPYEADLAALTITKTIVWNAPATENSIVVNDGSAWVIGDNTYKLTDKDGDATTYTITVARDVLKHTVSFNTHGGSAVASVEVVHNEYLTAVPNEPSKEDYIFQYWSLTDGGEEVDITAVQITENKEFHAVWASDGAIKLLDGATVNHTNYITGVTADETVEFMGNTVNYAKFSGTVSVNGVKDLTRVIAYNATTNKTKIQISAHNNSTNGRSILVKGLVEGASAAVDLATIALGNKEDKVSEWIEFNNAANRTIYIMVSSSAGDVYFTQVKVIESGETPMKQAGEAGYSLNFNKGRFFGLASTDLAFEGLNARLSGDYTALNSGYAKLNATSMSFTVASDMNLVVTTNNNKTYYVTKGAAGTDNETAKTGVSEFDLTAGTWYITAGASDVQFTNIAFELPKCEKPVFGTMSDIDLCAGDAFTDIDGTATVSDGGVVSYKWYKEGSETVLGTAATYTPSADGNYYVVATNSLADHQDNSATSDVVTVEHFDAAAIVTAPEDIATQAGQEKTLTIVASGANLQYVWYTCDDAEGTNPVAIVPAQTTASLTVTVPDGVQYYKVAVTDDCGADLSAVVKVEGWTDLPQVDVTASTVWDMNNVSANAINLKEDYNPSKQNARLLLANIEGVNNNSSFNSQALMFEGQHIGRTSNNVKHLAGQYVQFNVTVPGMVSVTFASNGDAQRTIQINGKVCSRSTNDDTYITYNVAVEPGSVEIEDVEGYVRISKIEFKAGDNYHRTVNPSYLGTLCWTNNAVLGGATLYEFAGKNEYNYLVFDEVAENRLEAGKPYIFMPENGNTLIKVYNTDGDEPKTESDLQPVNHMYGTFTGKTLIPGQDDNMYYFSASHIWAVKDFVVNINVPAYYCYVDYEGVLNDEPASAPAPGRRRVTMGVQGQQVATGIEDVQGDKVQCTKMLINGQLFILRGEKMYDAKGQLVK